MISFLRGEDELHAIVAEWRTRLLHGSLCPIPDSLTSIGFAFVGQSVYHIDVDVSFVPFEIYRTYRNL